MSVLAKGTVQAGAGMAAVARDVGHVGAPARGNGAGTTCFTGDTPVLMADGSKKRIDDVVVGDHVLTRDEITDDGAAGVVTNTFRHLVTEILLLHLEGWASIATTSDHRFGVEDGGFVAASDLRPNHKLVTWSSAAVAITSTERRPGNATVHSLTVDEPHTYFVGDAGLWVHNIKMASPTEWFPNPTP